MSRQTAIRWTATLCLFACAAWSGDPVGVSDAVRGLATAWPDASFSIDVTGVANDQAVLNRPIVVEYEAATPGYLTYLRISGHGDMTLMRPADNNANTSGTVQYLAKEPLGDEQLVVFFSSAPLNSLFAAGENFRALGSDKQSAATFMVQLKQLQASNIKIASRKYQYEVATMPGGTEYTSRGITYQILSGGSEGGSGTAAGVDEHAKCRNAKRAVPASQGTAIPAHIEFEFDSDRLTAQGKLDLDEFGSALISSDLRGSGVVLQGNTDAVGTDDYNVALSTRRAQTAKQYLAESFAIPSSRITTVGLGKSNPIMPNDSDSGRACNRRVDFVISKPDR